MWGCLCIIAIATVFHAYQRFLRIYLCYCVSTNFNLLNLISSTNILFEDEAMTQSEATNNLHCEPFSFEQQSTSLVNGLIEKMDRVMEHVVKNLEPCPNSLISLGGTSFVAGQFALKSA